MSFIASRILACALAIIVAAQGLSAFAFDPPSGDKSNETATEAISIMKRACIECHGPAKQEADLRLDGAEHADQVAGSLAPGQPTDSELLRRVSLSRGDEERMPPRGKPLSKAEVDTLRRWIEEGAAWPAGASKQPHWAYVAPVRPEVPAVRNPAWVRSPIDAFVLARLEREGLRPSPEADRETLIRRVSLDLTGLPPTPQEVDAFLKDRSPDAWERLVDRLLKSPQFGVKWARPWLDYARYADSHGFQRDDFRDLWAYRDWVVDALNADMPFKQFTVEQLAGDLLPNATPSQLIATGFNRCAPTNVEAGTEPEETRVNQVFDRVNTVGMVWLGSTMECCQCHDHKYDPFSMRDYYGLFAYFNNTEIEAERSNPKVPGSIAFRGTSLTLEDEELAGARAVLERQKDELEQRVAARRKQLETPDAAWEQSMKESLAEAPAIHPLEIVSFESTEGSTHEVLADGSILISGEVPERDTYIIKARTTQAAIRGIRLDALTDPSLPGMGPGRGDEKRPNFVLTRFDCEQSALPGDANRPVKFQKASADFSQKSFSPEQAISGGERKGWAINPQFRRPHWAVFETAKPFGHRGGTLLTVKLEQNFGGGRTLGRLKLSVVTGASTGQAVPAGAVEALSVQPADRTDKQRAAIAEFRSSDDPESQKLQKEKTKLGGELAKLAAPTTQVMRELAAPRASVMFQRGNYQTPGEPVEPAIPRPLVRQASNTTTTGGSRLHLAKWLASPENPLVGRATVNRWWSELFGQGIVATPEDFGVKGEPPTHPDLLDWLAVEFHENGGSIKHVLKTIVMSATYRQSSAVSPEMFERDDRNRLLGRGPRFRMDAEAIRDNALAIAGLVSLKQGGPPIKPYQPDGLWVKVGGQKYDYEVSPGEDRYRRGLYVVCKRGAPYPSFVNFDANNRMSCRVTRPRSNTPTQALTLLNDPVYVEAAMAFARSIVERPGGLDDRIAEAFRRATSRTPTSTEAAMLRALYEAQLADAVGKPDEVKRLIGDFPLPESIDRQAFAAWYAVCAALLNLDETITKG